MKRRPLKTRQKFGKYRIEGRLDEGGFAAVYKATDTLEGIRVALKIPYALLLTDEALEDFRREVRIAAKLQHEHILPLKNADFIDGRLVLAYPLGERTLADRLTSRMSVATAIALAEQMIGAVAFAHEQRVIHCDIKPENLILFADGQLKLTDFGIAKVAHQTIVRASGSGTVGYCAPEQAMGKPSFRSDVFSLGLILYRMLSGHLPEWPFKWPPPGNAQVKRRVHPDLLDIVRRAMELDPRKRFADAGAMLAALARVKSRALHFGNGKANGTAQRKNKKLTGSRNGKGSRHK